ncbi:MAG: rhomboid family intramembrane serine protease [Chloroflexi bacterium]|nr:rhomboid family intramembrane serine protease [Chloroflexota bacterium]
MIFSSPDDQQPPLEPAEAAEQPAAPQFIEVKIELPTRKPLVTYVILVVTILVYLAQVATEFLLGGDLPAFLGMKINAYIQAGQLWRLITPVLLHGSLLHIGFNMYALYNIGRGLEQYYGSARFLLLYLIAGFAGNTASFIFSNANSLGASTAIFGIVAAEGVFIYHNRSLFGRNAGRMLSQIGMVVLVNLMLGLSPGIDNWGHLGGLLGGLAFAWFAGPRFQPQLNPPRLANATPAQRAWLTAALEAAAIAALVAFTLTSR